MGFTSVIYVLSRRASTRLTLEFRIFDDDLDAGDGVDDGALPLPAEVLRFGLSGSASFVHSFLLLALAPILGLGRSSGRSGSRWQLRFVRSLLMLQQWSVRLPASSDSSTVLTLCDLRKFETVGILL